MLVELPLPAHDLTRVLCATEVLWPSLKGSRLLFTGGTGFFGRWMLESLLLANETLGLEIQATVLSRDPEAFLRRAPHLAVRELQWIRGSVNAFVPGIFQDLRFDAVVHLATEADGRATLEAPLAAIDVITHGTQRVLDVALQAGARRFLFASSGAIYGKQPPDLALLPEEFPGAPDPTNTAEAYAISGEAKRHAELLCAVYARQHGLGAVIARGFTFAGPAMPLDGKFAFGNFLRDALAGRQIVITGDGTPVRSYLHAVDLTVWMWTMLLRGTAGRAYNLGSENPVNLRDLAEAMARELGAPGVTVMQTPANGVAPPRYVPSTKRAREELGLRETIGLAETIRWTAEWARAAGKH